VSSGIDQKFRHRTLLKPLRLATRFPIRSQPTVRLSSATKPRSYGVWTSVGRSQNEFYLESSMDQVPTRPGRTPTSTGALWMQRGFPRAKSWVKVLDNTPLRVRLGKETTRRNWHGLLPSGMAAAGRQRGHHCAVVRQRVSQPKIGEVRVETVRCSDGHRPVPGESACGRNARSKCKMVMGLAAVCARKIRVEKGRVVQSNFHDYPLLRATEMPEIKYFVRRRTTMSGSAKNSWVGLPICVQCYFRHHGQADSFAAPQESQLSVGAA